MGNTNRVRIIRVSNELLASVLLLPPGCKIVGVSDQLYFDQDQIAIKVESPDFDPVPEGTRVPEAGATYQQETVAKFAGWSL